MRLTKTFVFGAVAATALAVALSPALGGEGGTPTFSIGDGEGPAGGDADVTLSLDNDDGSAVSAGVDIEFNDTDLSFTTPVSSSCTLDDRIASTHQVAGRIIEPGILNIEILVSGTPDPLPPLGNGALAVCTFGIRGDANVGDMFPLAATNVFIGDATGGEIPSNADDGVITVTDAPTPTASPTATGDETPTATATEGTPVVDTPTPMADTPTPGEETPTPDGATPTPTEDNGEVSFALTVNPPTQMGIAGGSAAIDVVLSSDPSGEAAASVVNTLATQQGLAITACTVAAEIPGSIEIATSVDGVPSSTVSATLGDGDDSVPSGTIYSCGVAIDEDASGTLAISCTDATVDGAVVVCTGAMVEVEAVDPPTPTPTNTATLTPTHTEIPTDTPTNTPIFDFDDDGCAVGPVAESSPTTPITNLLFLLVPAALLWRRRN